LDLAPTALLVAAACSGIGSCPGVAVGGVLEVEGRGINTGEIAHGKRAVGSGSGSWQYMLCKSLSYANYKNFNMNH
jgi:hypothetical protein